jgi:hypothetical protein
MRFKTDDPADDPADDPDDPADDPADNHTNNSLTFLSVGNIKNSYGYAFLLDLTKTR